MLKLLAAQPGGAQAAVEAALAGPEINMALLFFADFADGALALSNRIQPFTDRQDGRRWEPGNGLLIGLPDAIDGGEAALAPWRQFYLGFPAEFLDLNRWAASLVEFCGDRSRYRGRSSWLGLQMFAPNTGLPVGVPIILDSGFMDRMTISFQPGGAVLGLSVEGALARKGSPVYGALTYADQLRRHPGDVGLQFTTEAGKLVTWTDW